MELQGRENQKPSNRKCDFFSVHCRNFDANFRNPIIHKEKKKHKKSIDNERVPHYNLRIIPVMWKSKECFLSSYSSQILKRDILASFKSTCLC